MFENVCAWNAPGSDALSGSARRGRSGPRARCPRLQRRAARPGGRPRARQVAQGEAIAVAHLSLIEVGGLRLLLLVNHAALRRLAARSAAFSV